MLPISNSFRFTDTYMCCKSWNIEGDFILHCQKLIWILTVQVLQFGALISFKVVKLSLRNRLAGFFLILTYEMVGTYLKYFTTLLNKCKKISLSCIFRMYFLPKKSSDFQHGKYFYITSVKMTDCLCYVRFSVTFWIGRHFLLP